MSKCVNCGKEIPEDSVFCPFCGVSVETIETEATEEKEIESTEVATKEGSKAPQEKTSLQNKKGKPTRGSVIAIVILAVLIGVLAGFNVYQYYNTRAQVLTWNTEKENLLSENAALKDSKTKLEEQNKKLTTERDKAKQERAQAVSNSQQYKANSNTFEQIKTWIKNHCKDFHSNNSFYAASNAVVVKVGETVYLDITYTGNRNIWEHTTNSSCKVEWTKSWSGNRTSVKITGTYAGMNEIVFSLGDANKADAKESFRVLVIVA